MTERIDYAPILLRTLQREQFPLKASEVARWHNISPDVARRALKRLEEQGFVFQNPLGYWELAEGQP